MAETRTRLTDLQAGANFIPRHIGPQSNELTDMLKAVGASSLDDLVEKVVPKKIRSDRALDLPVPLSERNALSDLRKVAGRNQVFTSMIGMGYYGCVTPKVILRNILENPGWYTAYTPYQAEVSQGRLEALLNFQQMVCDLTGLELASASLLDEGTAAAEAMAMAHRVSKTGRNVFFVDHDTHPQTVAVLETRARGFGFELMLGDPETDLDAEQGVCRAVVISRLQRPGARLPRTDQKSQGARRHVHHGNRPAGACHADPAGRTGRRHCPGLGPALWRADGLWRPARGAFRHPRRVQARHAGPA